MKYLFLLLSFSCFAQKSNNPEIIVDFSSLKKKKTLLEEQKNAQPL